MSGDQLQAATVDMMRAIADDPATDPARADLIRGLLSLLDVIDGWTT